MFLKNKKFIISLLILTLLGGLVAGHKNSQQQTYSPPDVTSVSNQFNANLPMHINDTTTLVKTQIGNISPSLVSLDFFYSYYMNKKDVKNFNLLTDNMIYQTCHNSTMLDLLKNKVIIRHQFITLDKEKLPYIGVSLADCTIKGKEQ